MVKNTIKLDFSNAINYLAEVTKTMDELNTNLNKLSSLMGENIGIEIACDPDKFGECLKKRINEIHKRRGDSFI